MSVILTTIARGIISGIVGAAIFNVLTKRKYLLDVNIKDSVIEKKYLVTSFRKPWSVDKYELILSEVIGFPPKNPLNIEVQKEKDISKGFLMKSSIITVKLRG